MQGKLLGSVTELKNKDIQFYDQDDTRISVSKDKFVTVRADGDQFGSFERSTDSLKEVLSYELSTVPFPLVHEDGSLRKTTNVHLL